MTPLPLSAPVQSTMHPRLLFLAVFSLVALPIAAQTTIVVDVNHGPGSQFTQIQPAMNATPASARTNRTRVRPASPWFTPSRDITDEV